MSSKLGLKIKKLRSELSLENGKKFTQSDLAKALNISRSYLGDIESGRTIPNNNLLKKIATFFEIDISVLTNLEDMNKTEESNKIIDIKDDKKSDKNTSHLESLNLASLIDSLLRLNNSLPAKLIRDNINKLSEYEELEFKKLNDLPLNKLSLDSNIIKSNYINSYYDLLTKKILLLLDLEGRKLEELLDLKQDDMIKNNSINDSSPIAAHDKNGNFSKEDYTHDENIMDDDDFWNN